MRSTFRLILAALACGAYVCQPIVAYAGSFAGPNVVYTSNGATVYPSAFSTLKDAFQTAPSYPVTQGTASAVKVASAGVATGDVVVAEGVEVIIPNVAAKTGMTVARTVGWAGVARGAARVLPVVGQVAQAYAVYQGIRCYAHGGSFVIGALLDCDAGQATQPMTRWCANIGGTCGVSGASSTQVGNAVVAYKAAHPSNCTLNGATVTATYSLASVVINGNSGTVTVNVVCGGTTSQALQDIYTNGTAQACPASVDALDPSRSVAAGSPPGADGLCPTGRYNSTSPDDAAAKVTPYQQYKDLADKLLVEAVKNGWDPSPEIANPTGTLSGPASVTGPGTTSTTKDGNGNVTGSTTTAPVYNITYVGPQYTYNVTNTTTVNNGGTTTTTTTDQPPEQKTCGLPGQPECNVKVDETGTPTSGDYSGPTTAIDKTKTDATDLVGQAAGTNGKSTGWTFSFALPTGCTPLNMWDGYVVNPCQWQPQIHDLMSMVWAATTFFACAGMAGRALREG